MFGMLYLAPQKLMFLLAIPKTFASSGQSQKTLMMFIFPYPNYSSLGMFTGQ